MILPDVNVLVHAHNARSAAGDVLIQPLRCPGGKQRGRFHLRLSVTATCRQPLWGSKNRNKFLVPLR